MTNILTSEDIKTLVEVISNRQLHIVYQIYSPYKIHSCSIQQATNEYKKLEELKVKLKSLKKSDKPKVKISDEQFSWLMCNDIDDLIDMQYEDNKGE